MPNWRKLIVSGSDAHLNSLDVKTFISASNFVGDGSQLTNISASYLSPELVSSISGSITAFSSSITGRVVNLESTGSDHELRLNTLEGKTLLSSSAQIASDISGSFVALSSSLEQRLTSDEASISSLNAATSSYLLNTTDTLIGNLTVTGIITAQEFHTEFVSASILYKSGSTKFGDTQDDRHEFTGSVFISGSITALEYNGIFQGALSSSAQIASDISGSFIALSSSLEQRISILDTRVTLNQITGSDHESRLKFLEQDTLVSSSAQIATEISGAFASISQSIASDIVDIIDGTTTVASSSYSSFALTASYALNAGGGTGVGFPFSGSAVITGSLLVSGSTINGTFVGDGAGVTGVISSSYALTASYALNGGNATVDTGSLITTASAAGSTITFEKGDGSTFDVTITANVTPANALVTASIAGSVLTFEKGDASTFDLTLPAGGYTGSNATAHLNQTVAATTWSFAHNLDDRYPVFTVYDVNGDIIIPNKVHTVDVNNANIYFSTARTGTVTAVIASSISQISSVTSDFTNQTTVAVTHSLDTRNIHVSVYDTNHSLIFPESITLDTLDTVVVAFPSAQSGTVVVAKGGHIISGTAATAATASYVEYGNIANKPTLISSSAQIASDISGSFTSLSSSIASDIADIIDGTQIVASASYALTASYAESFTATSITSSVIATEYIDFDLNPTATPVEGRLVWNVDDGTLDLGLANATLQIGQEQYWYVRNNTASPIANGAGVMATGTLGASGRITAAPMVADGTVPAKFFLGVATEEIAAGADGYVTTFGKVRGIDTSLIPSGSILWCDPDTPGGLTVDEPIAPNLKLPVAFTVSQKNNGTLAVRATTGVRLSNSHDVQITSASYGELLMRSGSIWINSSQLSGSYGLTGSLTADSFVGPLTGTASYASNANLLDGINSTQFLRSDQSGTLTGDLTVTGIITAQEFHTEFVSASIIYQSGSTKFGDTLDDSHSITGSVNITGSLYLNGTVVGTGKLDETVFNSYTSSTDQRISDLELFSSSLDATFATDAELSAVSGALAASIAGISTDFADITNKPTLISSSLQFNTLTTPFTGSFTGSFYGDGSNLSGVTSYTDADTLSYINSLGVVSSSAQINSGSFSGSFFGDGTGLTGLGYGDTKKLNQTVAATTWSFNHNMNEQYPAVTVYNSANEVIQPTKIQAVSNQALNLYFGVPVAGTAVAVVGGVALTQEAGFNRVFTQTSTATTWSFTHNLGNKYPQIAVYDSNDELMIPGKVEAVDQNNAILYFDTPQAGVATATVGGTSLTASYANSLVITDTLLTYQENTDVDTGTETVATVSTTYYDGAFFDYVAKDGTNYRAGTVMAVWDGSSVQYNDNSTADIGDTSGVVLTVDILGTDARLRATVSSDNWNIKAFVRAL